MLAGAKLHLLLCWCRRRLLWCLHMLLLLHWLRLLHIALMLLRRAARWSAGADRLAVFITDAAIAPSWRGTQTA